MAEATTEGERPIEVEVGEPRFGIEVPPLTREQAIDLMDAYVEEGYRVELLAGPVSVRAGGRYFSLKVLIIEPILGADVKKLIEIAERFERPIFFNETEGIRIR